MLSIMALVLESGGQGTRRVGGGVGTVLFLPLTTLMPGTAVQRGCSWCSDSSRMQHRPRPRKGQQGTPSVQGATSRIDGEINTDPSQSGEEGTVSSSKV